jgi:predicted membrane protein
MKESMKCFVLSAVLLIFTFLPPVTAQETKPADTKNRVRTSHGDYITVKAAVTGPGDDLYFWWGHIGLLVEDSLSGKNTFYDWGLFSFDTENFFLDFAFGRLLYSCGAIPAEYVIPHTIASNRDLTLYTLDLPPEAKVELSAFAENCVLPENRNYWYHHFRDNCATRVRDIIDTATGGSLKSRFEDEPGRFTLRQHVRRHTWFSPFWDWALNFWMGQGIDQPITIWEEMFLPSEIALRIEDFSYTDAFGIERKLVSNTEVLSRAKGRPAVLDAPPQNLSRQLILGLCIAVLFSFLRFLPATRPARKLGEMNETWVRVFRSILGTAEAVVGLFFGVMGLLLFFMAFFTNHDYTYNNINIFFVNPLLLIAVPAGLIYGFTGKPKKRLTAGLFLTILWTIIFLAGLATVVIQLFPNSHQQNQPTQLLVLPFALVLSAIPIWIVRLVTPKKQ